MLGHLSGWLGHLHGRLERLDRPGRLDHAATGQVDDPVGDRLGSFVLVRGEQDRAAGSAGACEEQVEKITALLIKPRVRLVEQPEPCPSCDQNRERRVALLAGGAPADGK